MDYVYADNAATTRMLPEVLNAILPYLTDDYGNPSSSHKLGVRARSAVDHAREAIALLLSCQPDEIVFLSGGTEADNLALTGFHFSNPKARIITSEIEHSAVLKTCKELSNLGCEVSYLAVKDNGVVDINSLERILSCGPCLVSVMMANNETGVIQPISDITEIVKKNKGFVFTDAVQAVNYLPISFDESGIDLLSISGHKLGGPKGTGALIVRKGTQLHAMIHGGGQERGLRSGTENVAGIVGIAEAIKTTVERGYDHTRLFRMRERILDCISSIPMSQINGDSEQTLPGIINASFAYVNGYDLVSYLSCKGIYLSAASACSSNSRSPSHVLRAMGISATMADGSLRISLNSSNTFADVEAIIRELPLAVRFLREHSPEYISLYKQKARFSD